MVAPEPETGKRPTGQQPNTGAVHNTIAGFVSDWIFAWNFIKG